MDLSTCTLPPEHDHRDPILDDAPVDNFSKPISPARVQLRTATRQLADANDALAGCNAPIARLQDLVARCDTVERELEVLRQQHLAQLGTWLSDGAPVDFRPIEPDELLAAEQHLVQAQTEARAARAVLPDHTAVAAQAAEHVRSAMDRRTAALRQALIDVTKEYLPQLAEAYEIAQRVEAKVADLEAALIQNGDSSTAATVREMVMAARQKIAQSLPPVDPAVGQVFVSRLIADPEATL